MSWDNLTDAQLADLPQPALDDRLFLYALVAADRKSDGDVRAALDRAAAEWHRRRSA